MIGAAPMRQSGDTQMGDKAMDAIERTGIICEQPIRCIIIELQLIMFRAHSRQTGQQHCDGRIGKRLMLARNQPHHRHETNARCVGRWEIKSCFPTPGHSNVLQFSDLPINRIDFLRGQLRQFLFVERIVVLPNPITKIVRMRRHRDRADDGRSR